MLKGFGLDLGTYGLALKILVLTTSTSLNLSYQRINLSCVSVGPFISFDCTLTVWPTATRDQTDAEVENEKEADRQTDRRTDRRK